MLIKFNTSMINYSENQIIVCIHAWYTCCHSLLKLELSIFDNFVIICLIPKVVEKSSGTFYNSDIIFTFNARKTSSTGATLGQYGGKNFIWNLRLLAILPVSLELCILALSRSIIFESWSSPWLGDNILSKSIRNIQKVYELIVFDFANANHVESLPVVRIRVVLALFKSLTIDPPFDLGSQLYVCFRDLSKLHSSTLYI